MRSALYKTNTLSEFSMVLAHWNHGYTCRPNQSHYPDSGPTRLCSFNWKMCT